MVSIHDQACSTPSERYVLCPTYTAHPPISSARIVTPQAEHGPAFTRRERDTFTISRAVNGLQESGGSSVSQHDQLLVLRTPYIHSRIGFGRERKHVQGTVTQNHRKI